MADPIQHSISSALGPLTIICDGRYLTAHPVASFRADDDVPDWLYEGSEAIGATWSVAVDVLRTDNGMYHIFPRENISDVIGPRGLMRADASGRLSGRDRTVVHKNATPGMPELLRKVGWQE